MQSDSEYPMRQRSPLASAAAFIHKLCLSEVDLIERTAWLCNMTRAIHKWGTWSSGFWFTGNHISLCVCVCVRERRSLWKYNRELLSWCLSISYKASILNDVPTLTLSKKKLQLIVNSSQSSVQTSWNLKMFSCLWYKTGEEQKIISFGKLVPEKFGRLI